MKEDLRAYRDQLNKTMQDIPDSWFDCFKEFNNKMQGIADGTIQPKTYKDKKMKLLNRIFNFFYDPKQSVRKQFQDKDKNLYLMAEELCVSLKERTEQGQVITALRQRHAKLVEENKELIRVRDILKLTVQYDKKENQELRDENAGYQGIEKVLDDILNEKRDLGLAHNLDMETLRERNETICNLQDSKTKQEETIEKLQRGNAELKVGIAKAVQDKDTQWSKHYEELIERFKNQDSIFRKFLKSQKLTNVFLHYKPRVKK